MNQMKNKILITGRFVSVLLILKQNDSKVIMSSVPAEASLVKSLLTKKLSDEQIFFYSDSEVRQKTNENIFIVKNHSDKNQSGIRIQEFIGQNSLTEKLILPENTPKQNGEFDLLVIHDTDEFKISDENKLLNHFNTNNENVRIIYYAEGELKSKSILPKLIDKFNDQLYVVIKAETLRSNGIKIERQLSWEKSIEDLLVAYHSHPLLIEIKTARALIIQFDLEGALLVYRNKIQSDVKPDFKFFYLPEKNEGQIRTETIGGMSGLTEVFLSQLISKIIFSQSEQDFLEAEREYISVAITESMQAAHNCFSHGFELAENDKSINYPIDKLFSGGELRFKSADVSAFNDSSGQESIMSNYLFNSTDLIEYLSYLYVKEGITNSFDSFPYLAFKGFKTYDREEVEKFRQVKKSVNDFLFPGNQSKTLTLGVFGLPGSGKSFGVKRLAESFGDKIKVLEFNLSQFRTIDDLIKSFHQIRDENLKGKTPLVFYDEFDSEFEGKPLGWLRSFLAPTNDGEFEDNGKHTLGRAIFVFAGGIFESFQQFVSEIEVEQKIFSPQQLKDAKATDFRSRITSHLNIKGINKKDEADYFFSIRRAMVLRSLLMKHPGIVNQNGRINIDNDLLGAMMKYPEYKNGARSLENLIKQSSLNGKNIFNKSDLPPDDILNMVVDAKQFLKLMNEQNIFPSELIEPLAEEIHERWLKIELEKSSVKPTMKSWKELSDDVKDSNRQQAIDIIRKVKACGYKIISADKNKNGISYFADSEIEKLAEMEHERWMKEKISKGWTYGKIRSDENKIHPSLLPWEKLDESIRDLDRNAVKVIPELMSKVEFIIV